jgi:peptidoglycan/LPS O-acetylase OafA/YrhL
VSQNNGPKDDHADVITGLRGWAAASVFMFHVWLMTGKEAFVWSVGGVWVDLTPPVSIGFAGVTIFFVLSGYLLSLPFAEWQAGGRERPDTKRYLKRRLLRVLPAYWAQLAILLVFSLMVGWPGAPPEPGALIKLLFMNFLPIPIGVPPSFNMVWWTLPIELSFYLVLPVMAWGLKLERLAILMMCCLLSMILWRYGIITQMANAPINDRVYAAYQLPGAMDMFGMGMLTAIIQANREGLPGWIKSRLSHDGMVVGGLGLMIVSAYWLAGDRQHYWANYPVFYLWTPLVSIATALLILAGANGNRKIEKLFGNPLLVGLGTVSYSFYLWHLPVLDRLHAFGKSIATDFGFIPTLLLGSIITLIISTLSYRWIERPALSWRDRKWKNNG